MNMVRFAIALLLIVVGNLAFGQDNTPPTVKVVLPKMAKPGEKIKATVEVTFSEGLHAYQNPPTGEYQIPLKLTLDTKGFVLSSVKYPKGIMLSMGGDPTPAAVYEGAIKIPVLVTMPKTAGAKALTFTVSYQQCNDSACFPPAKVSTVAKILVKK